MAHRTSFRETAARHADGPTREPRSAGRRAWRRPRILERQRIEALAADCTIPGGKSDATCIFGFS